MDSASDAGAASSSLDRLKESVRFPNKSLWWLGAFEKTLGIRSQGEWSCRYRRGEEEHGLLPQDWSCSWGDGTDTFLLLSLVIKPREMISGEKQIYSG